MFLSDWTTLGNIALTAVLTYVALVVIMRITGKRTTSKMNSFDWIVTVALGSMVATVIISKEAPLIEGMVGIATLVLLQYIVAWTAARNDKFQQIIKASPRLLYYRGEFNHDAMRRERVTKEEIVSSLRHQGYASFDQVLAVVMETNAEFSIVSIPEEGDEAALENVVGHER